MKRQIKKHGNSFVIKLEPVDIREFELKEGDWIDIQLKITEEELMKKVEDRLFEKLKESNLLK